MPRARQRIRRKSDTTYRFNEFARAFIEVFPGEDKVSICFLVNGRGIWDDLIVELTPTSFDPASEESQEALRNCRELINLLKTWKYPVPEIVVGLFKFENRKDDSARWKKIAEHWSS